MRRVPSATKTVATWNVRSYRRRAPEVEALLKKGGVDFLCMQETFQNRRPNGSVEPLDFDGYIQSMPALHEPGTSGRHSMGVAVVSKTHALRRVAALQDPGKRWQILAVESPGLRIVTVYIKNKTAAATWAQFLSEVHKLKHSSRPTVVCGDFNAHHSDWSAGTKNSCGGTAIKQFTSAPPRKARKRSRERRGPRTARKLSSSHPGGGPYFSVHAPTMRVDTNGRERVEAAPTCYTPVGKTHLTASTVDFFLVAGVTAGQCSHATILQPKRVGGSDHLPVGLQIKLPLPADPEPRLAFLPTPHRMAGKTASQAVQVYRAEVPELAASFRECGNRDHLPALVAHMNDMLQRPWMAKVRDKPARFHDDWTRPMDDVAKQRKKAALAHDARQRRAGSP